MSIRTEPVADGVVVRPEGPLDAGSARIFREEASRWALSPGSTVIVDLDQVSFIDSSGIGALLGLRKRLVAQEGRVRLRNVPDQVARVLRMTRLDTLF